MLVEEIAKLKKQEITEVDSALDYLDNPTTGVLTVKIAERDKLYVTPIPVEYIENFINYILELQKYLKTVNENRNKLSDMALQVNYKNLYEIISELEETTSCPACGTNLAIAERNPYEYAKEQLKTFTEIELIQKKINEAAQNARENMREILDFISGNKEFIKLLQIKNH